MKKRHIITILSLLLCFGSAQPQFLKNLGKELKKTAEKTARETVNSLLSTEQTEDKTVPAQKQGVPEAPREIQTIQYDETSFIYPRITPATKFLKLPAYAQVSEVSDGVFSVYDRGYYAFFLKDGRMLFDYKWKNVIGTERPRFDNGVALALKEENIDGSLKRTVCILYRDGRVKELKYEYDRAQEFTDGIARLLKRDADRKVRWVYIDVNGNEIYPALTEVSDFSNSTPHVGQLREGLRPHYSYTAKKWGYIDAKGNVVITPQFREARAFSEGLAAVCVEENYNKKWGFIDRTGKFVIPAKFGGYRRPSDCRNGFITWRDDDNSVDYVYDKTGNEVKVYQYATPFLNGYALVKPIDANRSDDMQVVDTKFNVVGTAPVTSINKNDSNEDGLANGAGVYTISGGGDDPFVMLPNGRVIIRMWNPEKGKSSGGFIGTYSDDLYAKVRLSLPQGPNKYLKWFAGFMDENAQMAIVYETEVVGEITDPYPDVPQPPYIDDPTPEPQPEPEPIPVPEPIIIEKPIIYPIIIKWYETPPIGPTVVTSPTYSVTTAANPPEGGSVSGAGTYKYGQQADIRATANKGWKLTGITCNDPMVKTEENGGSVTVNGRDLTFTATFIKKDTIDEISNSVTLAAPYRISDDDGGQTIPCTVYLEMSKDKDIATAYGSNTSGFLTAIIDPNVNYPSQFKGKAGNNGMAGQVNAKFFFVPMRVSGMMEDKAAGKKYLVADGGQLMVGGVNVDCSDPLLSLFLNFIMSYNGNTFATVSDGRYRVEMRDIDPETGAFTLGNMERFSSTYGWLRSDDKRFKKSSGKSGFGFFPQKSTDNPLPSSIFYGCRLSPSEKRTDVMWTPPADWFESRNIFEAACKNLGSFMSNMQTDYDKFWNE